MEGRFWTLLTQKKYEMFFYDEHLQKCIFIERCINIGTALMSAGSLSVWLINNDHPKIYATIIVISEMVRIIQPHLPYQDRIRELREALNRLDIIYGDMENTFFSFIEDTTDDEINNKYVEYERKWLDCNERYFKNDSLPLDDEKINNKAKERRNAYFKNLKIGVERGYDKEQS